MNINELIGEEWMFENYLDRLTLLKELGISQSTLSRRMKYDNFPYIKMKGRLFFNKNEVKKYLNSYSVNYVFQEKD